ncbi:Hypothetical predicted protein [Cloeon dipterum]|uniref:Uncharacterized protein n=1 Tax=Cloeon dipterum TaxID=197152 RepID=A0A8S1DBA2_9INSE|nr:Hypothetical predicted protein [Cloeon dipterum]
MATLTDEEKLLIAEKRVQKLRLSQSAQTKGMTLVAALVASAVETNALTQSLQNEVEQSMANLPDFLVWFFREKYAVEAENEVVFWTGMIVYEFLLRSCGSYFFVTKELADILTLFPKFPKDIEEFSKLLESTPRNAQNTEQIISSFEPPTMDDEEVDIELAEIITHLKCLIV